MNCRSRRLPGADISSARNAAAGRCLARRIGARIRRKGQDTKYSPAALLEKQGTSDIKFLSGFDLCQSAARGLKVHNVSAAWQGRFVFD